MNILELAPRSRSGRAPSNVKLRYSWQKQKNNKSGGVAISFVVKSDVLSTAAYVKGDRVSIHINDDNTGILLISSDGDIALSAPSKSFASAKLAYSGVEKLMSIFPDGKNVKLEIIGVSTGKIHFMLPPA